jgi:hypothetical protein
MIKDVFYLSKPRSGKNTTTGDEDSKDTRGQRRNDRFHQGNEKNRVKIFAHCPLLDLAYHVLQLRKYSSQFPTQVIATRILIENGQSRLDWTHCGVDYSDAEHGR